MNKEKRSFRQAGFAGIIILPIIALIGIGIYYFESKKTNMPVPTNTSTGGKAENTVNPETSHEAVWKKYTNTKYLYSIKYPATWTAKSFGPETRGLQTLTANSLGIILSPNKDTNSIPARMLEIQAEGLDGKTRPELKDYQAENKSVFAQTYKLTRETTREIAGVKAMVLEGEHSYPKTTTYVKVMIFAKSDKDTYFTVFIATDNAEESLIFNPILDSFVFE